jgi:hypothetical protein
MVDSDYDSLPIRVRRGDVIPGEVDSDSDDEWEKDWDDEEEKDWDDEEELLPALNVIEQIFRRNDDEDPHSDKGEELLFFLHPPLECMKRFRQFLLLHEDLQTYILFVLCGGMPL